MAQYRRPHRSIRAPGPHYRQIIWTLTSIYERSGLRSAAHCPLSIGQVITRAPVIHCHRSPLRRFRLRIDATALGLAKCRH
jgi:hypothetical protein